MLSDVISRLLQRQCSLTALVCFSLLLLFYVLAPDGQRHLQQPGAWELVKLRGEAAKMRGEAAMFRGVVIKMQEEADKLREEPVKLQGQAAKMRGVVIKMQEEANKLREEVVKLREEPVKLLEAANKLQEEVVKLREEPAKMREQIIAQNEMIKKQQDQNWDLQLQMDNLQGNFQHCQAESGKHGQLVQELKDSLGHCERQNSDLRHSPHGYQDQSSKSQDNNMLWYILAFGLCLFLCCGLANCSK
ncbi:uncharacterized protein LOC144607285 [Rhinoraja longicauda]